MKPDTKESILADLEALKQRLLNLDKPKLEVGKVYKNEYWLVYITEVYNNYAIRCYGFNEGEWFNARGLGTADLIPATTEEWKQALDKERIKRGIVEGVTVKRGWINENIFKITGGITYYSADLDEFEYMGRIIYKQGQWAEVVEDKIMVGKWDVVFENNTAVIGLISYPKIFFENFNSVNRYACVKVLVSGEELTLDVCQKIINKLSK